VQSPRLHEVTRTILTMLTARFRIAFLSLSSMLLAACAGPAPAPGGSAAPAGGSAFGSTAGVTAPQAASPPDPARVYADLIGRTEDFARVARSPKEFEGKSVVLYGVRAGDLRPIENRFSMPLASTDGRTMIAATDRPTSNQLYLAMSDDFAHEARERRLLTGGAARGPMFVECRMSPQTSGRVTSYACEIDKVVAIVNDKVSESLWRGRGGALEYFRY
jgi:hypothetical protein